MEVLPHSSSPRVRIQSDDFDLAAEVASVRRGRADVGAVASFVGTVRSGVGGKVTLEPAVLGMDIEHYPGMTERAIEAMIDEARARFDICEVRVVHRIGHLKPEDQIVLVAVSAVHRAEAFNACEFLMDCLKTRAPFWKKEHTAEGARWVGERESDDLALKRWDIESPAP